MRHRWDLTPREAVALQRKLASRVSFVRPRWAGKLATGRKGRGLPPGRGVTVAGADVSCARGSKTVRVAVVVVRFPESEAAPFETVQVVRLVREAGMPYVPGLLSFREAPAVIEAFRELRSKREIDCLICDGQGVAHPRGLGLASHIGLWLGIPAVGCAKSRLCGVHDEPGKRKGDCADLTLEGKLIGRVLRTRDNVKPLFVSVGHMIDLDTACELVLKCSTRYRLPEPTRLAHHAAGFKGAEEELLPELRRIAGR